MERRFIGEVQNFHVAQKCDQGRFVLLSSRRQFDAVQQLRFRDDRDANVAHRNLLQPFQNGVARVLHDVGTSVGIQHVARHYGFRSCTGRSSIPSMKSAEATGASARYDDQSAGYGDRTTSMPSFRMKTSSVLN